MDKLFKCLVLALFTVMNLSTKANANDLSLSSNNPEAEISRRLAGLSLPLSAPASDAHLRRKLTDYLDKGSHSTERMLGRANQYFPVFEYYLQKHGMPESLKYLAVAESMLVPGAVSGARAAGLWQLMPATAREMGLRVDGIIDERLDLYRSTEAAVLMLKSLHQQFGDWHLALAAYNCGPGRVRRAIRAAGGHTYYPKVKRFLPRESQKYVAAYVAAAYTVNYYGDYGLTPASYLLEEDVASLKIHRKLNLRRMAKDCELSYKQIRKMNPSFLRGYIPLNAVGYRLRVPREHKWTVKQYLWGRPNLVMLDEAPELVLTDQIAADMGFSAKQFFFAGIAPERLIGKSTIAARFAEQQLNHQLFKDYDAVAMN
ncbi:MAG: lytic transglycosylase domain-containing protein [Bacteroidota bacterium]